MSVSLLQKLNIDTKPPTRHYNTRNKGKITQAHRLTFFDKRTYMVNEFLANICQQV